MWIQDHRENRENIKHYQLLNIEHLWMLKVVMHLDQLNGKRVFVCEKKKTSKN